MMSDEGYVKYSAEHTPGPAPDLGDFPGLSRLRTELFDAGMVGILPDGVGFGNVSALVGTGPRFIITGTATGAWRELPDGLWTTVLSADISGNRLQSRGPVPASSEALTHAAVYQGRADLRIVVHVHHRELFRRLIATGVPGTPADAAFGTPEMAIAVRDLVRDPGKTDGLLVMSGHEDGLLFFGTHPGEVLQRVWAACRASGI